MAASKQDVEEIVRCGRNPAYFLKKYGKIVHPKRGMIPFATYPFQDDCLDSFKDHRFNIVLKSRQLGLSTITAGYCAWLAMFFREKNILVIATKLATAQEFTKKVKALLDNVPKHLFLSDYTTTKTTISFSNGSLITATPTSPDAGRSQALSLLVIDECAWIKDFDHIWTGLAPTLSTGGNAILLSTPNGVGGQYYKIWVDGENDLNDFNTIKLPWHVHPEHDQAWFDQETRNLSKRKIAQEYECSFESSGDTFLQANEMEHLHTLLEEPVKSGDINGFWIWDEPRPGARYVVGADVSRGNSADYSTCHVLDMDTLEVVAEYMEKVPADKLADIMIKIGEKYNTALLAPENNNFGWFTACRIRDLHYPRLYYEKCKGDPYDYKPTEPDEKPGFSTQAGSRQAILTKLETVIRNRQIAIHSSRTFEQLRTFVWINNKAVAMRDAHDDLVMSLAIAVWIAADDPAEVKLSDGSLEKAMLKASVVHRNDKTQLIPDPRTMNVPHRQQIQGSNYLKPHDTSKYRGFNPQDFAWLLK